MIRSLRIQNFKAWQDTGRFELAPITGLFGTNSSEKSSILQLLLLLRKTVDSPDRSLVLDFGDGLTPPSFGTFQDVLFGHDTSQALSWEIEWEQAEVIEARDGIGTSRERVHIQGNRISQRASIRADDRGPVATEFAYGVDGVAIGYAEVSTGSYELTVEPPDRFQPKRRTRGRPRTLPGPVRSYGFPDEVEASYGNVGFLSDLVLGFERLLSNLHYLGPLREYPKRQYTWGGQRPASVGERGERAIDVLLAAQQRRETVSPQAGRKKSEPLGKVVASWLKELGLIDDFRVEPVSKGSRIYEVKVRRTPGSAEVLLTDVGFGVSQILPVIVQCFAAPPGSVVLLEQPEIHLHPAVQSGLADVLIDAVKRRGIQIIVESHSEHLLARLQRRMAEDVIAPKDVRLYFARATDTGSALDQLCLDLYGSITNWPDAFFGDPLEEAAAMTKATQRRRLASA